MVGKVVTGVDRGIGMIIVDNPGKRNALSLKMRPELRNAVAKMVANETVRVIILTGSGAHFCSGGDISDMASFVTGEKHMSAEEGRRRMRDGVAGMLHDLHGSDKPVLAAVEGCAYGAGLSLALMADIVVAGAGARFCLSFGRIGLVPDCGVLYTLPRLVGVQRAKELLFTARELDTTEALRLGLIMEAVEKGEAGNRCKEIAAELCQKSPAALALTKSAINQSLNSSFSAMLNLEAISQGIAYTTEFHIAKRDEFLSKAKSRY